MPIDKVAITVLGAALIAAINLYFFWPKRAKR